MHMAPHKRDTWQSCHSRHPFRDGPGHKNIMSGVKCHGKDFSFFTILRLPFFPLMVKKRKQKEKSLPMKFYTPNGVFMTWPITKWVSGMKNPPTFLTCVVLWDAMCISPLNLSRSWKECPNGITPKRCLCFININTSWSVPYANFRHFF